MVNVSVLVVSRCSIGADYEDILKRPVATAHCKAFQTPTTPEGVNGPAPALLRGQVVDRRKRCHVKRKSSARRAKDDCLYDFRRLD
jgi:hypothetical protein